MTSHIARGKAVLSRFAGGKSAGIKAALRVAAKGAFLVLMALMIVSYAVAVIQTAAPAPEPLAERIYS